MKTVFLLLVAAIVVVECNHLFLGTNVNRPLVHHQDFQKGSKVFRKTIDNQYYQLPAVSGIQRSIQGILAIDKKSSEATVNVTQGGIGYNFVNLRMKSERGRGLHYDIYIYA